MAERQYLLIQQLQIIRHLKYRVKLLLAMSLVTQTRVAKQLIRLLLLLTLLEVPKYTLVVP